MCWSENSSIASFIIGTILNIYVLLHFKTPLIYSFCIMWQWVLMMQLAEYLIWRDLDNTSTNGLGTKMALIFNITQPLVMFLCFFLTSTAPIENKIFASIIILMYLCFMLVYFNIQNEYKFLTPSAQCKHMNLQWWEDNKITGLIYYLTLIYIMMLLVRPVHLSVFTTIFITITVLVSSIFYSCGAPSMWCWFVVPFPFFFGIYYHLSI